MLQSICPQLEHHDPFGNSVSNSGPELPAQSEGLPANAPWLPGPPCPASPGSGDHSVKPGTVAPERAEGGAGEPRAAPATTPPRACRLLGPALPGPAPPGRSEAERGGPIAFPGPSPAAPTEPLPGSGARGDAERAAVVSTGLGRGLGFPAARCPRGSGPRDGVRPDEPALGHLSTAPVLSAGAQPRGSPLSPPQGPSPVCHLRPLRRDPARRVTPIHCPQGAKLIRHADYPCGDLDPLVTPVLSAGPSPTSDSCLLLGDPDQLVVPLPSPARSQPCMSPCGRRAGVPAGHPPPVECCWALSVAVD